jgi:hypothetical protein
MYLLRSLYEALRSRYEASLYKAHANPSEARPTSPYERTNLYANANPNPDANPDANPSLNTNADPNADPNADADADALQSPYEAHANPSEAPTKPTRPYERQPQP